MLSQDSLQEPVLSSSPEITQTHSYSRLPNALHSHQPKITETQTESSEGCQPHQH